MAKLIYTVIASLDGYVEDASGGFGWAEPNDEVHQFVNDLERPIGTHLYGRRMYETMAGWETDPTYAEQSPAARDFAEVWQAADKIVYSRKLVSAPTERTRIERAFDPPQVARLKAEAGSDLLVGGAMLAGAAFRAGLVDQCHLLLVRVVIGAGRPAFPDDVRLELELLDERRFRNGMVYLAYRNSSEVRSA
jgi:dihydrofolate reductase